MLNHNPHQFAKDGYCMYRDGDGVTQDYDEALKWFSKAAEQGHAEAKTILEDFQTLLEEL